MESQTMKHSHSILAQLVLPMQANPAGNVHGGDIMTMMDSAAGVAAQKHAHTNVVTARVDELNFKKPVLVGELVTCKAQVIYAGRSSMEVSLDENGKPSPVPKLVYDENNAYESKLYKVGEKKHILHNQRKS